MTVNPLTRKYGIKCLIVRFIVSASQVLKRNINEVREIKNSFVEEEKFMRLFKYK